MSIRSISILFLWLNLSVVASGGDLIPLLKNWDDKPLMADNDIRERIASLRSIAAAGETPEERLAAQVFLAAELGELREAATEEERAESLHLLNEVTQNAPETWQADMAQGLRLYILLEKGEFNQALELGCAILSNLSLEGFKEKGDRYWEAAVDGGAILLPETQEAFEDQIHYAIVSAQIQLGKFDEAAKTLSEISNEQERQFLSSMLNEAKESSTSIPPVP